MSFGELFHGARWDCHVFSFFWAIRHFTINNLIVENRLIPYTCFCDEQSVSLSFITAVWWLASVICFKQPKSSNFEKSSNSEKWPRSEKNASPAAQKKFGTQFFLSFCPTYIWGKSILQKTAFNLVKYGLQSPTYDLHLHKGGRHSVLYFSIQATEKYSTAMY